MVAAAVETAPSFRVVRREVLFDDDPYLSWRNGTSYDVHPDGRRFLMIRRGAERGDVVVVLHWLDELRSGRR